MELSSEQLAAVESGAPLVVVVAGAGSGKSRVIVCRVVDLVQRRDALPERILAVTFTRAAAGELRHRIAHELDDASATAVWTVTFHGLAYRLLQVHPEWASRRPGFVVWDEGESREAVIRAARDAGVRVGVRPDVAKLLQLALVRRAYTDLLRSCNALDYDSLEAALVSAAEAGSLDGLWDHVLIDEYQDTNAAQARFVLALAGSSRAPAIFVVGDGRQSIYRFRGAVPAEMLRLLRSPDWTRYDLRTNYRSDSAIVTAANRLARRMPEKWPDAVAAGAGDGSPTAVRFLAALEDEPTSVAELVAQAVSPVVRLAELSGVAVLARTWRHLEAVGRALTERRIPWRYNQRAGDPLSSGAGRTVLCAVRLLVSPGDDWSAEAVGAAAGDDVEAARRSARTNGRPLLEALPRARQVVELVAGGPQRPNVASAPAALAAAVEVLVGASGVQAAVLAAVHAWAEQREDRGVGVADFLADRAAGWTGPADTAAAEAAVTLSTVHGAKGLEWPLVVVAGAADGLWPMASSARWPDDLAEERRLFYVAITRAQRAVIVTVPRWREPWPGASPELCQPSRFVREMEV